MTEKIVRKDGPHATRLYPTEPDRRGYARFSHQDRTIYLGRHGTPESYASFALWSASIDSEGKAASMDAIRPHVDSFLSADLHVPIYSKRWFAVASVICTLLVCVTVLASVQILSSRKPPQVDGVAMSDEEQDRIRGMRSYYAMRDERRLADAQRAGFERELLLHQISEGIAEHGPAGIPRPPGLPAPQVAAKPPFPEIPAADAGGRDDGDVDQSGDSPDELDNNSPEIHGAGDAARD